MSEFTKGKWYITNNGVDIFVTSTEIPDSICNVGWVKVGNNEANARLIAAAPEMYNLLQNFSKGGGCFQCNFECRVRAKRLLARIDGEEHEAEAQE